MKIELNEEHMKQMVSEAMLRSLDDKAREALIAKAMAYLMTPQEDTYGRKKNSILQDAFQNAMYTAAQVVARELLTNDAGVQQKIRDLLNEALVKAFETDREATVMNLAGTIGRALVRERS